MSDNGGPNPAPSHFLNQSQLDELEKIKAKLSGCAIKSQVELMSGEITIIEFGPNWFESVMDSLDEFAASELGRKIKFTYLVSKLLGEIIACLSIRARALDVGDSGSEMETKIVNLVVEFPNTLKVTFDQ